MSELPLRRHLHLSNLPLHRPEVTTSGGCHHPPFTRWRLLLSIRFSNTGISSSGLCSAAFRMQRLQRTSSRRRTYVPFSTKANCKTGNRWWAGFIECCAMRSLISIAAALRKAKLSKNGAENWRARVSRATRSRMRSALASRASWTQSSPLTPKCCARWTSAISGCRNLPKSTTSRLPTRQCASTAPAPPFESTWFEPAGPALSTAASIAPAASDELTRPSLCRALTSPCVSGGLPQSCLAFLNTTTQRQVTLSHVENLQTKVI
jgi:hypothetical protein